MEYAVYFLKNNNPVIKDTSMPDMIENNIEKIKNTIDKRPEPYMVVPQTTAKEIDIYKFFTHPKANGANIDYRQ